MTYYKRSNCRRKKGFDRVLVCQRIVSAIVTMFLLVLFSKLGAVESFDRELAIEINYTCAGCHGEYGQGVADGTYPRLAGMDADYLARQLRLFKSRKRLNIPMFPYAIDRDLPEEDVVAISQFLSSIELLAKLPPIDDKTYDPLKRLKLAKQVFSVPRYSGDVKTGKFFYNKECANCHGRDGLGKRKKKTVVPRLAGQHSLYLLRQIEIIGKGLRLHDEAGDAAVFKSYSKTEIANVLAYLSVLDDE
ncbi:MAG: c-type cytochrome [bacterium]|nr:c-type cytochrome [bacterium]